MPATIEDTIDVNTEYGLFTDFPNTTWKELKPYWSKIVASIIEVIQKNNFDINTVTFENPTGFIASSYYWDIHEKNPKKAPLEKAKLFIKKLKEKPKFIQAITEFNRKKNVNWLTEENTKNLGGRLYGLCFPIQKYLKSISS